MNQRSRKFLEVGSIDHWMIATISLIVLVVGLGALATISFINYNEQKTDVDGKISDAVAVAKKDQADIDEAKFADREKEPNREFIGPDDYGRVSFNYPKTWSLFISKDASSGGSYEAIFNPISVSNVTSNQQFALRVTIEQKDYDKTLSGFDSLIKKGDLKSSSIVLANATGARLDGVFSKDIHGSMVIFKIRDKILTIRTDAEVFKSDFDNLIATIKFNQ
ncbi:MAG: hypothetical protein WCQ49_02800 [Candidatus Saccharibacteria bacterium]